MLRRPFEHARDNGLEDGSVPALLRLLRWGGERAVEEAYAPVVPRLAHVLIPEHLQVVLPPPAVPHLYDVCSI